MMDPRRKSVAVAQTAATSLRKRAAARTTAGRWSLLCEAGEGAGMAPTAPSGAARTPFAHATDAQRARMIAEAKSLEASLDAQARILLCRYGVLFRELLTRESNAPKWRDLAPVLRRLEARGEIRGGRFVSGAFGEQFALPEAVDSLREARRASAARAAEPVIVVAAADPLNLVGIVVPGEREAAIPGREVRFQNGAAAAVEPAPAEPAAAPRVKAQRTRSIADILRGVAAPVAAPAANPAASMDLFS